MAGFGAKVKLTVDRSSKVEFNKQINDLVGQIKISNKFTVLQKDMDRVRKEAQAMLNSNPMTLKVNKIDCSAAVTNVKRQLQTMLSSLSVTNGVNITGLKDFLGTEGVDNAMRSTADAANAAVQKMNEAKAAAAGWAGQMEVLDSIAKAVANTYKSGLSGSNMIADEAEIQRITAAYNEWAQKVKEVKTSRSGDIEALQQEGLAIQRNITAIQNKQAAEAKAASAAERAARAAEEAAQREEAANQAELASLRQIAGFQERMTKFLQSNSKLSYSDAGNSIRAMLTELNSGATITIERLREMEGEFANIRTQATTTGSLGRSMLDALSKAYERFGGWMIITRSLTAAIHTIKDMVTNVREIDSALAQLQIVTGATDAQITVFLENATVLAKDLGKSITDVLSSIETFSRLGYNLEEATTLAEYANILANVAAVDSNEATTGMTSIIKGFNMDVTNAEHVADVLVEIGQKYAVSAGEMMEAYEKSGAALNATNTSFEKSAGLIAAANAAVQNASTVGTALKTISARIRGSKTELEELGEDTSDLAQGFSKYASEIKALTGFDIMVEGTTDTFKDIYDIFEGIARVWDDLTDTQQARIAEILGGTRQLQVISSILSNWSDAAGAYSDAMHSAGVATEANAIFMDTIDAKLNQFRATFEELSNTFISSDFIKGLVDFGTGALDILTKIIEKLGALPTMITAIVGAYTAIKNARGTASGLFDFNDGKMQLANRGLVALIKNFNLARRAGASLSDSLRIGFNGSLNNTNLRISAYNEMLGSSTDAQAAFMSNLEGTDNSLSAYLKSLNGGTASLKGYMSYCKTAGIQTEALGAQSRLAAIGVTVLNTALNMLISIGISLAISAIISGISSLINKAEEAREASIRAGRAAVEESDNLLELAHSYIELSNAVDAGIGSQEELVSVQDELIQYLKTQGIVVQDLADDYDTLRASIIGAAQEAMKTNISTALAGAKDSKKQAVEDMSRWFGGSSGFSASGEGVEEALKYLKDKGFSGISVGTNAGTFTPPNSLIKDVFSEYSFDEVMENYRWIEAAMNAVREEFGSENKVFEELSNAYNDYNEHLEDAISDIDNANRLIAKNWLLAAEVAGSPTSVDEFKTFRNTIIDNLRNDKDFDADGTYSAEELVNSMLSENSQYKGLLSALTRQEAMAKEIMKRRHAIASALAESIVGSKIETTTLTTDEPFTYIPKNIVDGYLAIQRMLEDLSDEELEIAYKIVAEQGVTSWDEVKRALSEYNSEQAVAKRRADELGTSIRSMWNSEGFTDAKSELLSMLSSLGEITPDKIEELAGSSSELAYILEQDGMNAQFLAVILENLASGGDGISLVTAEALALNKALGGMVDEFDKVTYAKAKYDAAMSVREKDTDFKSYAAAFEELNKQFEAGTTNSNAFWAAAEYLFGSDQLAAWGWSEGLDEIYTAMQRNESIFSDADSAGAGFIEKLYEMAEAGKLVNDEGEKLLEISKDSHGGYIFDIDQENIAAIADQMGLTEEAVLSCLKALSMWGDVDFFNIDDVLDTLYDLGIAMDSYKDGVDNLGEASETLTRVINLDRLTEQLLTLGKTQKEVHDIITALSELDNVSFLSVTQDVDSLIGSLDQLGIVTKDGINISVNYEGLGDILQNLGFTKEEAEGLIKKLDEVDNITLTNANGEIKDVTSALEYIQSLEFTDVTESVDGIGGAIEDVNDESTDDVVSEIENIGNAADKAVTKIYSIGDAVSEINGKTATVYYDVKRKNSILSTIGSVLGFAEGTDGAPAGPALVGEEDPELIKSGNRAYLAGVGGPEIVDLNKGDQVYTADETKKILHGSGKHIIGAMPAFEGGAHGGVVINKNKTGIYGTAYSPKAEVTAKVSTDSKDVEDALEDTLKKLKEELSDIIGNFEHSIYLLEKNGVNTVFNDRVNSIISDYQSILDEARNLGIDLNKTVYGNIDTNNRQMLEWTDENLSAYKSALESWGATVDEMRGSISTVFGSSAEYDGVEIAFSPILQTDTGPVFLDSHAVDEYICGLIDKAGEGWTNEDLLRLDTEGLEFDGRVIKNLIADIGETAIQTGQAMHFTGSMGAVAVAFNEVKEAADAAGLSVDDFITRYRTLTADEIKAQDTANAIVSIYQSMQDAVHQQVEKYRALGLDENSDYIQELQKQWWDYEEKIQKTIIDSYEKMASSRENAIKLTENWMDNAKDRNYLPGVSGYANDIVDYYKRIQDILHEQAEFYRSKGYSDTSDEVSKLSDLWWDYAKKIKDIRDDVVDNLLDMVDAASDMVDEIQKVNDVLHDAAEEFASNGGFISVDTLQSIYDLGPQYMQYLEDENGLLVINEQRINAVIAAKTEQLALENALAYVERLRLAALGESNESLEHLCFATTEATGTTWGLVYAQLEQMRLAGELTDSQYNAAMHNIRAIQSLARNAISGIGRVSNEAKESLTKLKEELTTMQDGVEGIIKYVMDMLKHRIQQQIDALEEMKDAYAKIIELRKEALEAAKDEADYEDEVAAKIKEIAKLQERINALSLDDSRDAQAQKIKLEEEMSELQKELADTQADYAREAQEEALDDMQEAYEQQKDSEIAVFEQTISSYQKLYDMAINYINQHWQTLYQELISWNYEYGSVLNQEITDAWAQCEAAAQRYGTSVQSMLAGLKAEIASVTSQLSSMSSGSYSFGGDGMTGNTIIGTSDVDTSISNADMVKAIVSRMKKLSAQWSTFNSKDKNDELHRQAAVEAAKLDQYGVHATYRESDGTWWITKDSLNPSSVGKLLYNCYHTGGYVDDMAPLSRKEVPAILEQGELVLDAQKEKGLYRLIDFTTALSEKLGKALGSIDLPGIFDIAKNGADSTYAPLPAVTNNQNDTVHFGDVYIYGANDETAKQHQEINRKFTNEVLAQLRIKR